MNENERVTIEQGVAVGVAPAREGSAERPLLADVYRPPASLGEPPVGGWPSILLVHGGAWQGGDRGQLRGYGILFARSGWLTVACEYRLSPQARWPEHLHDVKAALRWMRAGADELGINPDRVVISGNSAGAHLALLVAGTPGSAELAGDGGCPGVDESVAACIAVYPPTVIFGTEPLPRGVPVAMLTDRPDDDVARQASPLTWVGPDFPPTLLLHGSADQVVSIHHTLEMYRALREARVPTDLHIFADQPHGFDANPPYGRRIADEILFFLERYVPAPDTAPVPSTTAS